MVDTSDEWISTRTGIKERRILKGEGLASSDMGAEAVKGLLEKRGIDPAEVDMVLCATVTPDMKFPATANLISHKAGIKNAFSYDMNAACSGFLYALVTAANYVESGKYKKSGGGRVRQDVFHRGLYRQANLRVVRGCSLCCIDGAHMGRDRCHGSQVRRRRFRLGAPAHEGRRIAETPRRTKPLMPASITFTRRPAGI